MADQPLWHGRFTSSPAEALLKFTESLSFDKKLWRDDVAGSIAHVKGLAHSQLITAGEAEKIIAALNTVADEMATEKFEFVASDEDIHTAIERRVTQIAGDTGQNCTRVAVATTKSPRRCDFGANASWLTSPNSFSNCAKF